MTEPIYDAQDMAEYYLAEENARLKAEVERLRAERGEWRHAAEKGAALCRAVTNDLMDDTDWFDSAKDLYDEVISLAAKAKVAAAQPEEESR